MYSDTYRPYMQGSKDNIYFKTGSSTANNIRSKNYCLTINHTKIKQGYTVYATSNITKLYKTEIKTEHELRQVRMHQLYIQVPIIYNVIQSFSTDHNASKIALMFEILVKIYLYI